MTYTNTLHSLVQLGLGLGLVCKTAAVYTHVSGDMQIKTAKLIKVTSPPAFHQNVNVLLSSPISAKNHQIDIFAYLHYLDCFKLFAILLHYLDYFGVSTTIEKRCWRHSVIGSVCP